MIYERLLRPLLFRLDPEAAHNMAIWAITRGLIRGRLLKDPRLESTHFGLKFPNPLGLAAGIDKNAVAVNRWAGMGFGFAEIGTVTAHPQPGNPKPRLFRYPEHQAVINRMGFNNEGSESVAKRLAAVSSGIPLGVNLGKSKVTSNDAASEDYRSSMSRLAKFADYVVVNVSSPNTPGLRDLQSTDALRPVLQAVMGENPERKPVLVKVAPDLHLDDLTNIALLCREVGAAGIIATNTTLDKASIPGAEDQIGGLSGRPVWQKSNAALKHLASLQMKDLKRIGVGGIFSGADIYEKLTLGADLTQVYTGWIYGGPAMPAQALLELLAILKQRGIADVSAIPRTPLSVG